MNGGNGGGGDDDGPDGNIVRNGDRLLKQEEWWHTTLQVSIPFLVAGIGTIGAGIVLGRVEVILLIIDQFYGKLSIVGIMIFLII